MGQIIMTVKAIDWSEGNVGHVHVQLAGGFCKIDWGDGKDDIIKANGTEWLYAMHPYPKKSKNTGGIFNIIISSDCNNIIGIMADSGDMNVEDIDINGCQSLKFFSASYLIDHFDLKTNPGIKKCDLKGEACASADFSNSTGLEELNFCFTSNKTTVLDLSKCNNLKQLYCINAWDLKTIKISNRSSLKEVTYNNNTPLDSKTLEILHRIVIEKNGGVITKEENEI